MHLLAKLWGFFSDYYINFFCFVFSSAIFFHILFFFSLFTLKKQSKTKLFGSFYLVISK